MGAAAGARQQNGGESVKNVITVEARRFPLLVVKQDNQEPYTKHIVLTKEQLQASQLIGQSSKELIYRICARQGYAVLDIGKAQKRTLYIDMDALWEGGGIHG